jgi:hypothetical protein
MRGSHGLLRSQVTNLSTVRLNLGLGKWVETAFCNVCVFVVVKGFLLDI